MRIPHRVRRNRAKRLGLSWGDSSMSQRALAKPLRLGASAVLPGPAPGRCRGGAAPRPSHNSMLPAARRTARPQPLSGYMYPARSTRLCARQRRIRAAPRCPLSPLWALGGERRHGRCVVAPRGGSVCQSSTTPFPTAQHGSPASTIPAGPRSAAQRRLDALERRNTRCAPRLDPLPDVPTSTAWLPRQRAPAGPCGHMEWRPES
jgi:hypothetical protein